jgi:hypothetical protein
MPMLGAVSRKHQRFIDKMFAGDARWRRQPIMHVQNIKIRALTHGGKTFLNKMVEKQNPRQKIRMPNLAACAVNFDAVFFLVLWGAWKI